MLSYGLKDKVVCVTGGASGIGLAGVEALAREGAHVAILDLNSERVESAVEIARSLGAKASGAALDVRDANALEEAADKFEAELGPVWGLFACAGISGTAPAEELGEDDFFNVIDVNLKGLFLSCRTFGRRMIKRKSGAIVLVGSIDGISSHPGRTHYVASKHGVSGIAKNLAAEWGRHGIRVNCIAPGFVDTPLLRRNMPAGFVDEVLDRTPLGRMGNPEEMAAVALFLLSEGAAYINGVVLPIDGGLSTGFFIRRSGGDYSSRALLERGVYSE